MKALIFNSGLGSRLGKLTEHRPKSMVELGDGETIFHRQLRVLSSVGVREVVVTTGPHADMLEGVASEYEALGCTFHFVNNPVYDRTNYIYSMWLARELLRGQEVLMLHGDLVFDAAYVAELLALPAGSYGSVDPELLLPEKDFKARVINGEVLEVGVNTWGEDCLAFQAMYRLTPRAMDTWLEKVDAFVEGGETGVYAENAANAVFSEMHVKAHPYTGHVLEEIDTPEDLLRVSTAIRARDFSDQPVFMLDDSGCNLVSGNAAGVVSRLPEPGKIVASSGLSRPLIVADPFLTKGMLEDLLGNDVFTVFSDYSPNPSDEQVRKGVHVYRDNGCDGVISVGGGSAIDVAKCIKLWCGVPGDGSGANVNNPRYCDCEAGYSGVKHIAVPTTAGTGSESTHFAVVYVDGEKSSVSSDCLQPDMAILVPSLIKGLPDYQKKSTMLDALCQAIESYWSVASCAESREYSARAIPLIMDNWSSYMSGDLDATKSIALAANLAGKAINLTTTTAAHAMSYKLTSLYGIAHGHAVAMCLPYSWNILLERGDDVTKQRLKEIDALMTGCYSRETGIGLKSFEELYESLGLPIPTANSEDCVKLAESVNPQRMSNFPIRLTKAELKEAYTAILGF